MSDSDRPRSWTIAGWPWGDKGLEGRCVGCGLLSRRRLDRSSPGVEEVTVEERAEGKFFQSSTDGSSTIPWCLVHAWPLANEVQEYDQGGATGLAQPEYVATLVITKQRDCDDWYEYYESQSPVEHRVERDMYRLREIEQRQAADSKAIAEANLRVAEALKDIAQQTKDIHEQSQRTAKDTDAFMATWTKIAVVVAVIALGVVVLTFLFPENGKDVGRVLMDALTHIGQKR